jgi:transaldolase
MKKFIERIKIKIFADGAKKEDILLMNSLPYINGFTTNPTLMRKAGIHSYEDFSKEILATVQEKPLSLEVFSDDFNEMEKQARKILSKQTIPTFTYTNNIDKLFEKLILLFKLIIKIN